MSTGRGEIGNEQGLPRPISFPQRHSFWMCNLETVEAILWPSVTMRNTRLNQDAKTVTVRAGNWKKFQSMMTYGPDGTWPGGPELPVMWENKYLNVLASLSWTFLLVIAQSSLINTEMSESLKPVKGTEDFLGRKKTSGANGRTCQTDMVWSKKETVEPRLSGRKLHSKGQEGN